MIISTMKIEAIHPLEVIEEEEEEVEIPYQMRRYDKSNVECFNYHKYGHHCWKCRNNVLEL